MAAKPRILLIDDDASVYQLMGELAGEDRVRIEWRACGRDGLRAYREGRYDLVLLDHQLPDMLGTDILKELREANGGIPVVMLTGYATVDVAIEAMKRGATDFFTKPIADPAAFIRFLNRTLRLEEPLPLPAKIGTSVEEMGPKEALTKDASAGEAPPPSSAKEPGAGQVEADAGKVEADEIRALCARLEPPVALSRRERDVAAGLLSGHSNKEIAASLHISERTVKNHLTNIYGKFQVDGRSHLFNLILTQTG